MGYGFEKGKRSAGLETRGGYGVPGYRVQAPHQVGCMARVHPRGIFCSPNFLGKNILSELFGRNAWWVRVWDFFLQVVVQETMFSTDFL